jgi:hypothetical protein
MFEYLMPALLLPREERSRMDRAMVACVQSQKRRGRQTKTPWGSSESAFFSFDQEGHYQYKAHGVQALALKRGMDRERVVAPYASFLALQIEPRGAADNLRRMEQLGLAGPYGLYEAVDFTPSRWGETGGFQIVRSYMAHHLGMSLLAVDNALNDNIMQRRFLLDRAMSAYRALLQER